MDCLLNAIPEKPLSSHSLVIVTGHGRSVCGSKIDDRRGEREHSNFRATQPASQQLTASEPGFVRAELDLSMQSQSCVLSQLSPAVFMVPEHLSYLHLCCDKTQPHLVIRAMDFSH